MFSEEQRELHRQRRSLKKEVRNLPRGDLCMWQTQHQQQQEEQNKQQRLTNKTVGNSRRASSGPVSSFDGKISTQMSSSLPAGRTVSSDLLNSLDAKISTQTSSSGTEKGHPTDSAHRPWTASSVAHSTKKKQRDGYDDMTDDIAHVTVDLEKIRRKTIKDFAKTWRTSENIMIPSMRSEIVVQLLDEEPIVFKSRELDHVDLFDRYQHFDEFDRIREESSNRSDAKKTVHWGHTK